MDTCPFIFSGPDMVMNILRSAFLEIILRRLLLMTAKKSVFTLQDLFILTLGAFFTGGAIYYFLNPLHLIIGSASGIAIMLAKVLPLPLSFWSFVVNGLLLVIGFIFIGKEFGSKTVYISLVQSPFIFFFERFLPVSESLTGSPLIDLFCFTFIMGMAQAILFRIGASTGGMDVITKILNVYFHMDLSTGLLLSGAVICILSAFLYDIRTMIIGILGTYMNSIMLDHFLVGFSTRKRVCIIADSYEEIRDYIVNNLNRGATLYPILGAYQNKDRVEIQSILTKPEFGSLMRFIQQKEIPAFITAGNVSEIYGSWRATKPPKLKMPVKKAVEKAGKPARKADQKVLTPVKQAAEKL